MVAGVVGVTIAHVPLLLWAGAMTGIATGTMLWARWAWSGVSVSARFRPARVFAREPLKLVVRVTNRKRLPVPIARIAVWLPVGLRAEEGSGHPTIRGFRRRFYLAARSEVVFEFPVETRRRGEYWLDRVGMELSDLFDLAPVGRELFPEAAVMVLPEPLVTAPLRVRRRLPFGAPAPAARMFEQRERFGGIRPYEPGDPLNRIHWKLSMHTGDLQTKLFEPTRSAEVLLVLDVAGGEPFWDAVFPSIAEDTIGKASFLALDAIRAGWRVGMVANAHFRRGRGPIRIRPSSAAGHEAVLFAALARMPNEPTSDLAPVLREVGRTLGRETTAVVVSPRPGPSLLHEMAILRRRGVEVLHVPSLEETPSNEGSG